MLRKSIIVYILVFTLLSMMGCSSRKIEEIPPTDESLPPASESAVLLPQEAPELALPQASSTQSSTKADSEESTPESAVASDAPNTTVPVISVAPAPKPDFVSFKENGTIEVSDDIYRDIANRTLETATALKSGWPVSGGVEDLLKYMPDYVVDIQGMKMNLERKETFFANMAEKKADRILVISVGPDEIVPIMVETYRYQGSGSKYQVEQIYAFEGKVTRKNLERDG